MSTHVARWLGIDITTTEMALAVSDGTTEDFVSLKMRRATLWTGNEKYPAFDLAAVPGMLAELLDSLQSSGWDFSKGGVLSVACRQHDMVVLDKQRAPLMPALSWQCNAATAEVGELNAQPAVVSSVGLVEPRFILAKMAHVLRRDATIAEMTCHVMTTGDWVLGILASRFRLSTSDALSNGLLDQASRALAADALRSAGLNPDWFPEVLQSGHVIGDVKSEGNEVDDEWKSICTTLGGWQCVAGLGDNHASALGCGMRNEQTLVVSAGTSGTINLACAANTTLNKSDAPSARFEFYRNHSLMLRMLAYCGDWYNRFLDEYGGDLRDAHPLLNQLAGSADLASVRRVECDDAGESYRPGWTRLSLGQKVASVQFSIAVELLLHVKRVLAEVPQARELLQQYVLTGGLSQSEFFQNVF